MTEIEQRQIFNRWLDEHKGILFKIVRAYAFTDHDQEDLFQEIAIKVWKSVPDFRGESKPSTWIYRVALFAATVWVRQEKKRPDATPMEAIERILNANQSAGKEDERLTWLYEQIGQLEPPERSVCLLMLDGYKHREIAELLGISGSNVGVKIHRVKQHLTRKSKELKSK